jgi:hypothetical protein
MESVRLGCLCCTLQVRWRGLETHWTRDEAFSVSSQFMVATVRAVHSREECCWSHECKSVQRAGVGTNGILECNICRKARTVHCFP